MQTHKSRRPIAMMFALLSAFACKPTEFQSSNQPVGRKDSLAKKELPAKVSSVGLPISCEQEKSAEVRLNDAQTSTLNFAKNCVSDGKSERRPADIVFVVDITASMEDSLNTVKNGVERFALQLRQDKGWDARFAAVGYRDMVTQIVPFSDEKSLALAIRGWYADGGDDVQEAGQSALAAAVRLLSQDSVNNPSRAGASKIILYIADAISYAMNGNHKDFSTTQLEQVFAALPAELKTQMKFYHSTARQVETCSLLTFFGCAQRSMSAEYAAHGQLAALSQKIALSGRAFEFPFTESIMLSEFMDEFIPGQACSLKSVVARDQKGNELARVGQGGDMRLPSGAAAQSFIVEVERCCAGAPAAPAGSAAPAVCSTNKKTLQFIPK